VFKLKKSINNKIENYNSLEKPLSPMAEGFLVESKCAGTSLTIKVNCNRN
jgi:hypothetical protein